MYSVHVVFIKQLEIGRSPKSRFMFKINYAYLYLFIQTSTDLHNIYLYLSRRYKFIDIGVLKTTVFYVKCNYYCKYDHKLTA
jgi:hypothetical protein